MRNHAIPVIKPCSFHPFLLKMLFSFDTITNLWLFFNNRQQFYIKIPHSTASQSGGILKGRISISLSSSFINWIFLLCPLFCFLFTFFYKKYFTLSKHNNLCQDTSQVYIFTKGCYDEKTKAYEADHSDPADRDIACHHRIYYLFCSERKPVILDVTVFDVFLSDLFMGNVIFV